MTLQGLGVWSAHLRFEDSELIVRQAARLERLGYTCLWVPDVGGDVFGAVELLLRSTQSVTVATGILNVQHHGVDEVAGRWAELPAEFRSRLLLGVGVSHPHLIGGHWGQPISEVRSYLEGLQRLGVPGESICVGALEPVMVELARDCGTGAHPYNTAVAQTALARETLGDSALLAPEITVLVEREPATARDIGRQWLRSYARFPNYLANWRRLGYTERDIELVSDRLIDDFVAWGDVDAIAQRVDDHYAVGADHVCLQVLIATGDDGRPVAVSALNSGAGADREYGESLIVDSRRAALADLWVALADGLVPPKAVRVETLF